MNNFTKTFIYQMARRTKTQLTPRHFQVLEFANEYYYKNKVGPLFHMLKIKLGSTKEELLELFPHGLLSVYSWVGIPIQNPNQGCKPIAEIKVHNYREVYFDNNGTTDLRDEVKTVLLEYFSGKFGFGNPSSSTKPGKAAYEDVFAARAQIAKTLEVTSPEIVFTGGGSEANNLAIKGIAFKRLKKKGHIISSQVEHPSVLKTLEWLEGIGFTVTLLDIDREGMVAPQAVQEAIRPDTILVSIMVVNNEIGTINPFDEIGGICTAERIPFMVDAIQAYGKIPLNPKKSGISLLSLSGHKIYAPKGIGALFIDDRIELSPLIHGGEQEFGLRAGTENVAYIKALGRAATLICSQTSQGWQKLQKIRDLFLKKLDETVPGYILNGSLENRLPNNLNIGFPNVDSGALLLSLNQIGVFVSSGSACQAGSKEVSYVIQALGVDTEQYGTIRFSFGLKNTEKDVEYLFQYLPTILQQLQNSSED